jgi:hypothetical protein
VELNGLQLSRTCAKILNDLCKELGLANLAERFHGDDPNQWMIHNAEQIDVVKHGYLVAKIDIKGRDVRIVVNDLTRLIRPERVGDFNPIDYGLTYNDATDWKGEKQNDLEVDWSIPDQYPVPQGPRNYLPQTSRTRPVTVIKSV